MINELDKVFVQTKFYFGDVKMLMLMFINVNNVHHIVNVNHSNHDNSLKFLGRNWSGSLS